MSENLLEINHLVKHFPIRSGVLRRVTGQVQAVDDVSFAIKKGETLGLVGESGCGKTTVARTLLRLIEATSGNVYFEGTDVLKVSRRDLKALRRKMQIIFQDPYGSLDPRRTVAESIAEGLVIHNIGDRQSQFAKVQAVMEKVGLSPTLLERFPHEFSGGQRQRIGIARALAVKPEFLVCDEAVAALDVSIQAQVLNLFIELRNALNLTYLFISHDLGVVRHLSDRVVIMYLGRVVECAPADTVFSRPKHPYTQALLQSELKLEVGKRVFVPVKGEIPSPLHPPGGCHFHPRCPKAMAHCATQRPVLRELAPGHLAACHLNDHS